MTRALLLYAVALEASFDGTALAEGMLPNSEIAQCIKEVMEPLRDDVGATLDFIYPVPGIPKKDKKNVRDHITAIHILRENGLKGSSVIGAYHARRVMPLMTRMLPLYAMAPEASFFDGTALAEGMLPNSVSDDTGAALDFIYPMPRHPPMQLEPGHIVFTSFPFSCLLFN